MEICCLYVFLQLIHKNRSYIFFDYNDVRVFKVFQLTAGCIRNDKNEVSLKHQKKILCAKTSTYNIILYQTLTLFKFLENSYVSL